MLRPKARTDQLVVEKLVDEYVVYDLENKKAHNLNPISAWIWQHCDGSTTVDQMVLEFERDFHREDSRHVILSGLKQLQTANLLLKPERQEFAAGTSDRLLSRRSVVAAGSALMPAIASILVPTAAAAKSKDDKGDDGGEDKEKDKDKDKDKGKD